MQDRVVQARLCHSWHQGQGRAFRIISCIMSHVACRAAGAGDNECV